MPLRAGLMGHEMLAHPARHTASRADAISTKALLASLLIMGVFGAGAAFVVHSLVSGDQSQSPKLEVAEKLRETAGPFATPTPISLAAALPPTLTPLPTAASLNSTAIPIANLASTRAATAAPPSRAQPKLLHHVQVHLYPFPVPGPAASTPIRGVGPVQALPEEASGTNPYDHPALL
jgi:hypothetical protein